MPTLLACGDRARVPEVRLVRLLFAGVFPSELSSSYAKEDGGGPARGERTRPEPAAICVSTVSAWVCSSPPPCALALVNVSLLLRSGSSSDLRRRGETGLLEEGDEEV